MENKICARKGCNNIITTAAKYCCRECYNLRNHEKGLVRYCGYEGCNKVLAIHQKRFCCQNHARKTVGSETGGAAFKKLWNNSAEFRDKRISAISERNRRDWQDINYRKKMSAINSKVMTELNNKWWKDSSYREKMSKHSKNTMSLWQSNPEKFSKAMEKSAKSRKLSKEQIDKIYELSTRDNVKIDWFARNNMNIALANVVRASAEVGYLYLITFKGQLYCKLGYTRKTSRTEKYDGGVLRLLVSGYAPDMVYLEAMLHTKYKRYYNPSFGEGRTELHYFKDIDSIIYDMKTGLSIYTVSVEQENTPQLFDKTINYVLTKYRNLKESIFGTN